MKVRAQSSSFLPHRFPDQRLKLQFLRALDAIDTHRSLLKASAALGLSQPALSKSLREHEDALQCRLFERHSRGVSTTEVGAVFVRSARRILGELRRLNDELECVGIPGRDALSVGVLPVAAAGVVPGALTRLKASHPETRVRLQQGRTEELLPLLASGEIDLIVGRIPETVIEGVFECEALWSEQISLVARAKHPLFGQEDLRIGELQRWGVMLLTTTPQIGAEVESLLEAIGIPSIAPLRSSSDSFIREMLHGTDWLAIVPQHIMAGDLMRGTLRIVPLPVSTPNRRAGLIATRGRILPPASRTFVSCLRAHVARLAECGLGV